MKKLFLYFVIALLLHSCNSDLIDSFYGSQCLPAATQSGKNTFGCKVNDENWIDYNVDTDYDAVINQEYKTVNFNLECVGGYENELFFDFSFLCSANSEYIYLGTNYENYVHITRYHNSNESQFYSESGFVRISRYDTIAKIISGTFEIEAICILPDSLSSEKLKITEGRFDFKYKAVALN